MATSRLAAAGAIKGAFEDLMTTDDGQAALAEGLAGAGVVGARKRLIVIGDSNSKNGTTFWGPDVLSTNELHYSLAATLTNLTASFVTSYRASLSNPTGSGTLSFVKATNSMTWAAYGETAGPAVDVSAGGFFTLQSSVSGHSMIVALNARYLPSADKSDSVNITGTPSQNHGWGTGYTTWLDALSGGAFEIVNMSITGNNSSDVLSRWSQIDALSGDIYLVMLGTNDAAGDAGNVATYKTNMETIVSRLTPKGKPVVVCAPIPALVASKSANQAAQLVQMATICYDLAASTPGVDFVDTHTPLIDPTVQTGYAKSSCLNVDGMHTSAKGAYIVGKAVWAKLQQYVAIKPTSAFSGVVYNATYAPNANLITNGLFVGHAGTHSGSTETAETGTYITPTSWTATNSGTTIACATTTPDTDGTPIPRTGDVPGNWYRHKVTGGATAADFIKFFQSAYVSASNYAAGDLVVFSADVRISGTGMQDFAIWLTGATAFSLFVFTCGAAASNALGDLNGDTVELKIKSRPFVLPAGTTNLQIHTTMAMATNGAVGTFDVQNYCLRKVNG